MKVLDLFCGPGGASMGIHLSGHSVIGVDIFTQLAYPFEFYRADALTFNIDDYDFIWASPPCQAYSIASAKHRKLGKEYPDLVEVIRDKLIQSGKPYIIENVEQAPLINPIKLCGTMFPELKVFRHRLFESNLNLKCTMKCNHKGHKAKVTMLDGGDFYTVAGHNYGTREDWRKAMGIDWMKYKKELAQAIPPVYSIYLMKQVQKLI